MSIYDESYREALKEYDPEPPERETTTADIERALRCPICREPVRASAWSEIAHMEERHPEVIRDRLIAAGILPNTNNDDLPF